MKNRFLYIKFLIINLIFFYLFLNNSCFFSQEIDCEEAKKKYLVENPDVAKAGMDAWNHYKIFGKKQGRKWPECGNQVVSEEVLTKANFGIPDEYLSRKKQVDLKLSEYLILKQKEDSLLKIINTYIYKPNTFLDTNTYKFLMNREYSVYILRNISTLPYYEKYKKIVKPNKIPDYETGWIQFVDKARYNYKSQIIDSLIFFQNKYGKSILRNEMGVTSIQINTNFYSQDFEYFYLSDVTKNSWSNRYKNKSLKLILYVIKKYHDLIIMKEQDRAKLAKRITGVDEKYFLVINNLKRIQDKIKVICNEHVVELNQNHLYFGEKSNNQGDGFGYLLAKSLLKNQIIMTAEWNLSFPSKIMEVSLYSGERISLDYIKPNSNLRLSINKNGLLYGEHNGRDFHGSNVLALFNDGAYFLGNYINGVYADGLYVWANGEKYLGGHDSGGKRKGFGKYFWPNGSYYEGEWYNNLENGYGKLVYSNGAVSEGIWQNNTLVKSKETIEQEKRAAEEMRVAEQKRIQEEENQRKARERNEELGSILAFQMLMGEFDKEYKKMGGKHVPICQNRKCGKQFKKENGWSCDNHETAIKGVNVGRSVLGGMLTGNSDIIFPDYCSLRCARDDGKCW